MSTYSPILICGAGISGLSLAQGLLRSNIPFRIFERDPALNVRSQGYRVRIFSDGINSLKQVLTPELFARLKNNCGQVRNLEDLTSNARFNSVIHLEALTGEDDLSIHTLIKAGSGFKLPHLDDEVEPLVADRSILRSVLFSGLEEFTEFAKEVSSYESTDESVKVIFSDGTEANGSILIGADGRFSRIQKQLLPNHIILDTEARWLFGKTIITAELEKNFHAGAQQGMGLIYDRTRGPKFPVNLIMEPMYFKPAEFKGEIPPNYMYWVLCSAKQNFNLEDNVLLKFTSEQAASLSKRMVKKWHPSLRILLDLQDSSKASLLKIDSAHPVIPPWKPSRVTLIGDAIHSMSPTGVSGSATALLDSALLAKIFREEGVSVDGIGKYEAQMREYAKKNIASALLNGTKMFGFPSVECLKRC